MFLASELIKNLHAATFASMLMKSSGLLHEAVRDPFSICKHILSIFWGWKRLFSKHTEAEHKIHHSYNKIVFALCDIANMDQTTLPFVLDDRRTYDTKGSEEV